MTLERARSELAPGGVLRAGINMGNPLLVTGRTASGDPTGVAPDMAHAIAARLDVPVRLVPFAKPSQVADAAGTDAWDICLIGAEPQRADKIAFTPAYVEIEATYLVPADSPIATIAEVDRPGVRIAVMGGSAFGLWLDRNIENATLVRTDSAAAALDRFIGDRLEALAGLRPALEADARARSGARLLDGRFMAVQQAIGTLRENEAATFLRDFVREAIASGLVAGLIERHRVTGLSVAGGITGSTGQGSAMC